MPEPNYIHEIFLGKIFRLLTESAGAFLKFMKHIFASVNRKHGYNLFMTCQNAFYFDFPDEIQAQGISSCFARNVILLYLLRSLVGAINEVVIRQP